MTRVPWHRVFHPLGGADPLTLLRLLAHHGPPSARGALPFGVALAASLLRLPFTLAEAGLAAGLAAALPGRGQGGEAPVFIVGYPRSGTTHLHTLMAASGRFATVPPVLAAMPWEARGLGRALRPFMNEYLPETRIIDAVRLEPDSPTEDEVALANMCALSYFHAIYMPRRFARDYPRGFTFQGAPPRLVAARGRALRRYVAAMGGRRGRLVLKNPAYAAQLGWLLRLFPQARVVHIHRDPRAVFASNARALGIALRELSLQPAPRDVVEETILATYPQVMERLVRDAALMPRDRFAELSLEALVASPSAELGRVWEQLRLPEPARSLDAVERHLAAAPAYPQARHALAPAQSALVEARWRPWLDRYGTDRSRAA